MNWNMKMIISNEEWSAAQAAGTSYTLTTKF